MDELQLTRQDQIRAKGFDMSAPIDYGKIKVGNVKTLNDAVLHLGALKETSPRNLGDKRTVLKALADMDIETLRDVSNYFYRTSGIYQKVCNYFATMYRYDWYVVPEIYDEKVKEDKVLKDFTKILTFLDNSYV